MVRKSMLPFLNLKEERTACQHPPKPEDLEAKVVPLSLTPAYEEEDTEVGLLKAVGRAAKGALKGAVRRADQAIFGKPAPPPHPSHKLLLDYRYMANYRLQAISPSERKLFEDTPVFEVAGKAGDFDRATLAFYLHKERPGMLAVLTGEYGKKKPIETKTYTVVALHLTMDYNSMAIKEDYNGKPFSDDVGYNLVQQFNYDLHMVPSDVAERPASKVLKITFVGLPFRPSMLQGQVSPKLKEKLIDDGIATGTKEDEMTVEQAMYWLFHYGTLGEPYTRPRRYRYYNAAEGYASLKWRDNDEDKMFDDTVVHANEVGLATVRRVISIFKLPKPDGTVPGWSKPLTEEEKAARTSVSLSVFGTKKAAPPKETPRSTSHTYETGAAAFNSPEFWELYSKDKSIMVHYNPTNHPEFTAMAITAVTPDGMRGPSYVQLGGSYKWSRVERWSVEKGRLRVYTHSGSYVAGFNAKSHAFHDF
jgi:hypothetical protein